MCVYELGVCGHPLFYVWLLVGTCVSSCVFVLACLCGFNLILCPRHCVCMSRFACISVDVRLCLCVAPSLRL